MIPGARRVDPAPGFLEVLAAPAGLAPGAPREVIGMNREPADGGLDRAVVARHCARARQPAQPMAPGKFFRDRRAEGPVALDGQRRSVLGDEPIERGRHLLEAFVVHGVAPSTAAEARSFTTST